jgi:hypothetical protein
VAGNGTAGQGTAGQGVAGNGTAGQGTAGQGTAGQGTAADSPLARLPGTARARLRDRLRATFGDIAGLDVPFEPDPDGAPLRAFYAADRTIDRQLAHRRALPPFLELMDAAVGSLPADQRAALRKQAAAEPGPQPPSLGPVAGALLLAHARPAGCAVLVEHLNRAGWKSGQPFSDQLRQHVLYHVGTCSSCRPYHQQAEQRIGMLPPLVLWVVLRLGEQRHAVLATIFADAGHDPHATAVIPAPRSGAPDPDRPDRPDRSDRSERRAGRRARPVRSAAALPAPGVLPAPPSDADGQAGTPPPPAASAGENHGDAEDALPAEAPPPAADGPAAATALGRRPLGSRRRVAAVALIAVALLGLGLVTWWLTPGGGPVTRADPGAGPVDRPVPGDIPTVAATGTTAGPAPSGSVTATATATATATTPPASSDPAAGPTGTAAGSRTATPSPSAGSSGPAPPAGPTTGPPAGRLVVRLAPLSTGAVNVTVAGGPAGTCANLADACVFAVRPGDRVGLDPVDVAVSWGTGPCGGTSPSAECTFTAGADNQIDPWVLRLSG